MNIREFFGNDNSFRDTKSSNSEILNSEYKCDLEKHNNSEKKYIRDIKPIKINRHFKEFEQKLKICYIHKKLQIELDDYLKSKNIDPINIIKLEEGLFAQIDYLTIIGIVPIGSDSIYNDIFGPFEIKIFSNGLI